MPTIIRCPHCLYPILVPARSRGRARCCKQCGGGYRVARDETIVRRLPRSIFEASARYHAGTDDPDPEAAE